MTLVLLVAYMTLRPWCMADSAAAATGSQSPGSIGYGDVVGGWRSHMFCMLMGRLVASMISPTTAWAIGQVHEAWALHASQWVIVDEGSPIKGPIRMDRDENWLGHAPPLR